LLNVIGWRPNPSDGFQIDIQAFEIRLHSSFDGWFDLALGNATPLSFRLRNTQTSFAQGASAVADATEATTISGKNIKPPNSPIGPMMDNRRDICKPTQLGETLGQRIPGTGIPEFRGQRNSGDSILISLANSGDSILISLAPQKCANDVACRGHRYPSPIFSHKATKARRG
jgi:hypothetical protein